MTPDTIAIAAAIGVPRAEYREDYGVPSIVAYGAALDAEPVPLTPTQQAYCAAVLRGEVAADRVAATKWLARYRIEVLAGMTPHARENWQTAMQQLTDILQDGGTLTAEHQADRAFARAAARWIAATRAKSDEIEATPGLSPFAEGAPWPPLPDPATVRPVPKYVA